MSNKDGSTKSNKKLPKVTAVMTNCAPNGASLDRVICYDPYRRENRCNHIVEGFWFDQNQFENLIDSWSTKEDLMLILDTTEEQLDIFCKALYGGNFDKSYRTLLAISRNRMRKAIDHLASQGNATALNAAKSHYAALKDENEEKTVSITIKNDLD